MKLPPEKIDGMLASATGNPWAMFRVAGLMRRAGQEARALALCAELKESAEGHLAEEIRRFMVDDIPGWHFSLVRDAARLDVYDSAMRRAIRPGMRVLEIGAGSGILAMMAARAGAAEVITCEVNPAIAAVATEIIALNGYADRVRVIARHSDQLDVDVDLGGPADLLVSEIIANDMVGEGVLPSHERAVRKLLVPGATVIPGVGVIRVALASDGRQVSEELGMIGGFDLSPLNRLRGKPTRVAVGSRAIDLRSDAADLFRFDFAFRTPPPTRATVTLRSEGGTINAIVQWIALELDGEGRYENRPDPGAVSNWAPIVTPLPVPIETVPGQIVHIHGAQNGTALTIWTD
jgi:hypothetical protein